MLRCCLALLLLTAAAAGQTSATREQQRAFEQYSRIIAAQQQFGNISGFSGSRACLDCGPGYVHKLAPRTRASFVSVTTLAAPKKARKELLKAEQALLLSPQELGKAATALRAAVKLYPEFAAAWSLLGKIQLAYGFREEARDSFLRAVAADGAFVGPHADLARISLEDRDWPRLEESARRMLRANPYFTLGHLYLAVADFNQGATETAQKHALDALETDDAALFPETHHLLGQIYETRGDRRKAATHFRHYLESNPPEPWYTAVDEHVRELERP
jgi:tetratricopeptide (TPR) repeat protein